MSRRRYRPFSSARSYAPGERQTISAARMEEATTLLNQTCLRECHMLIPNFTREQLLPWLFRDEDLAKLRAVNGMVETPAARSYALLPYVTLTLSYDNDKQRATTPAIEASRFFPQGDRTVPLMAALRTLDAPCLKYGLVKHLLRWFDKNATLGAIRNYWPAAMQLCPDVFKDMAEASDRYSTPADIGTMLPLIRETAGTVAAMALVPKDAPVRPFGTVRVTFHARYVEWEGVKVYLDTQTINL